MPGTEGDRGLIEGKNIRYILNKGGSGLKRSGQAEVSLDFTLSAAMVLNYHGIDRGPHCKRNITDKIVGFVLVQFKSLFADEECHSSSLGLKNTSTR